VATFAEWAARHGVTAANPGRSRGRRPIVAASAAVLLVAVTTVRVAQRGVIWPWTPTATHTTPACAALDSAGLDQYWPSGTRTRDRDDVNHHELGEWSACWWSATIDHPNNTPYRILIAEVKLHTAFTGFSPVAMACQAYRSDRQQAVTYHPLHGIGDEAFADTAGDRVRISGRRANVTVSVELWLDHATKAHAESAARQLVTNVLAAVQVR